MIETRGALYYPYIHPRNADWVKGTLLAFGQIHRVVPDGFPLNDSPEIALLRDYPGPRNEPLLRAISPEYAGIEAAEGRLRDVLARISPEHLTARFGFDATMNKYGQPNMSSSKKSRSWLDRSRYLFEIHEDKLHYGLLMRLQDAQLAWRHRTPASQGNWWCVHPELGSAIMSVIAIAAAQGEGLDIVTEEMTLHHALAALDEQTVLTELLEGAPPIKRALDETQAVDHLAHIVLTTSFDLSSLPMKDVAELVRDGNDLRDFKRALSDLATAVPAEASPKRREELLIGYAEQIIELWQKQKKTWPRRLLDALRDGTADDARKDAKKAVVEMAKAAVTGGGGSGMAALAGGATLSTIALSAATGIGLSAIFAVGPALFSGGGGAGPYRYLTRVTKAGASLLVVPKRYRDASSVGA